MSSNVRITLFRVKFHDKNGMSAKSFKETWTDDGEVFATKNGRKFVDLSKEDLAFFAGGAGCGYVSIPQPEGPDRTFKVVTWPIETLVECPLPGSDSGRVESEVLQPTETSQDGVTPNPVDELPVPTVQSGMEAIESLTGYSISESNILAASYDANLDIGLEDRKIVETGGPSNEITLAGKPGTPTVTYVMEGYDGPPPTSWVKFDRSKWMQHALDAKRPVRDKFTAKARGTILAESLGGILRDK